MKWCSLISTCTINRPISIPLAMLFIHRSFHLKLIKNGSANLVCKFFLLTNLIMLYFANIFCPLYPLFPLRGILTPDGKYNLDRNKSLLHVNTEIHNKRYIWKYKILKRHNLIECKWTKQSVSIRSGEIWDSKHNERHIKQDDRKYWYICQYSW